MLLGPLWLRLRGHVGLPGAAGAAEARRAGGEDVVCSETCRGSRVASGCGRNTRGTKLTNAAAGRTGGSALMAAGKGGPSGTADTACCW